MLLDHLDSSVPARLVRLFAIENKSELEKYANTLTIQSDELMHLIVNSEEIGYVHFQAHKEFQPEGAQLTANDLNMLSSGDPEVRGAYLPRLRRQVRNLFAVRKHVSAHLFRSATKWHLFYFTFRDMEESDNQFKQGSHLHFVNYLWPHHRAEDLQQRLFATRRTQINDSLHIRYIETPPTSLR